MKTTRVRIKSQRTPGTWYKTGDEYEVYSDYQITNDPYLIPVGIDNRIIYLTDCEEI